MKHLFVSLLFIFSFLYSANIEFNNSPKDFFLKQVYYFKVIQLNQKNNTVKRIKLNNTESFFYKIFNKWTIKNKNKMYDFYIINGLKNEFPVFKFNINSQYFCSNLNKENYCLVLNPFYNYKLDAILFPDYLKMYPFKIFGYKINNQFIVVFLNIKTRKYITSSILNNDYNIKTQFEGINFIFNFFKKENIPVFIIGNFYTKKNTLKNFLNQNARNHFNVYLNFKDFIINKNNKIFLLENLHLITKKNNLKFFAKKDKYILNTLKKEFSLKKDKDVLKKYEEKISSFLPIDIKLILK